MEKDSIGGKPNQIWLDIVRNYRFIYMSELRVQTNKNKEMV